MSSVFRNNQTDTISSFYYTSRYLDDILDRDNQYHPIVIIYKQ